jgi:hypothetical protein
MLSYPSGETPENAAGYLAEWSAERDSHLWFVTGVSLKRFTAYCAREREMPYIRKRVVIPVIVPLVRMGITL